MNVWHQTFLNLDLRFKLSWRKNIGAKAMPIMLVKLTPSHISKLYIIFTQILKEFKKPQIEKTILNTFLSILS
jgi:hypothetical protein